MFLKHLAVLASLTCLATPAVAVAATQKFKGESDQERKVTFKLKGGKVVDFVGGVNMFCSGEGIEFNAAIPPGAIKVSGGKFSHEGRDKIDSVNLEISGKIKGKKASGKLFMSDSRYDASSQSFSTCSGSAKWTAKAR